LVNERSPHEKLLKNEASKKLKAIKKESNKVVNDILDLEKMVADIEVKHEP